MSDHGFRKSSETASEAKLLSPSPPPLASLALKSAAGPGLQAADGDCVIAAGDSSGSSDDSAPATGGAFSDLLIIDKPITSHRSGH